MGQEPFGYFGALFQSDPPSGGTLSGRYRRNGYVHNPTVLTGRPPSRASPHSLIVGCQMDRRRLGGRHRRQASSHIWTVGYQVDRCWLEGRHRRQASSHIWIVGCQVDRRRLGGRHRRQASSHIWILGCQVDRRRLAGRLRRQTHSPRLSVATHRPHHNRTNQLNRSMVALSPLPRKHR